MSYLLTFEQLPFITANVNKIQNHNLITGEILIKDLKNIIQNKAYDNFVKRGMSHGNDIEDWLNAEDEILNGNNNQYEKITVLCCDLNLKR